MSIWYVHSVVGIFNDEGPPVPIPNTEVKLICAEDTWLEAARENRSMPTQEFPKGNSERTFCSLTSASRIVGDFHGEGPPVPIPNTEVKLPCSENTWMEAARENRSSPTFLLLCFMSIVNMNRPCELTIMVEHMVLYFSIIIWLIKVGILYLHRYKLTSIKSGVGKSFSCINIGIGLARAGKEFYWSILTHR